MEKQDSKNGFGGKFRQLPAKLRTNIEAKLKDKPVLAEPNVKHILVFLVCFVIGALEATLSAGLNQIWNFILPATSAAKEALEVAAELDENSIEFYEDVVGRDKQLDLGKFIYTLLPILGIAAVCFGMIKIILQRESTMLSLSAVSIGSSVIFLSIFHIIGWHVASIAWVILAIFSLLNYFQARDWVISEFIKWEDKLEKIRLENLRKREEAEAIPTKPAETPSPVAEPVEEELEAIHVPIPTDTKPKTAEKSD